MCLPQFAMGELKKTIRDKLFVKNITVMYHLDLNDKSKNYV